MQLCYNAGASFKSIIIVYYVFGFVQGMLFTFTIFPKDLSDETEEDDGKCRLNSSKTENIQEIKSKNAFTISREIQQNNNEYTPDKKADKIDSVKESPSTGARCTFFMTSNYIKPN